jgi:hypothetical protein
MSLTGDGQINNLLVMGVTINYGGNVNLKLQIFYEKSALFQIITSIDKIKYLKSQSNNLPSMMYMISMKIITSLA